MIELRFELYNIFRRSEKLRILIRMNLSDLHETGSCRGYEVNR